ncbi:hypothetical protein [uncultured Pseudoteredinibacter sp.]|uniref:hypothetical protein n=1 Tax=uncultured Pseudoteredinibacter sp. TaxID=1641701 RepID=UPI00262A37A5|nr:hypothetical protein [uncultured Pseudoteredinibacter sp.]
MTDQPTKTKQQLLAELESIMSMLDDDAVIPTLDTVVEPSASEEEPSASKQEPSASKQEPSASKQEPPASEEKPLTTEAEPAASEQKRAVEVNRQAAISEQLISEAQSGEAMAPALEDRQQLSSELDDELRQAMEIDIKIPEVQVPNSQTLFGVDDADTNSADVSDNDIETAKLPFGATLEPEKATDSEIKNTELENTDIENQDEPEIQSNVEYHGTPQEHTTESFAVEESHDIYTPKEGLISDKLIAAANAQLQTQKDSDTTLPQQNPFPAPNRKLHLFNGEAQAEAPLPGQQQLFDQDSENANNSGQVITEQVASDQATSEQENPDSLSEEQLTKPQNPFKSSNKSGSAYPPASLLSSMRRPKPQHTIKPDTSAGEAVKADEKPKASPFEQQESLSLSQSIEPEAVTAEQITLPETEEPSNQAAIEAIDINAMVDELVQEQLPKLEAELRKRLTQALCAELEL